jgi:LacI family kdg operon repressor
MSAPTISDVARIAGVGKTSVSRFLNGELAALSPALRERIGAAIATLSYRPNQMARGLKRGRTRLIGILVADLQNPYSVSVMQGMEYACRQLGLMPMVCNAGNEIEAENRFLDLLRTYRAEGLIVNPVGLPESALHTITDGGVPVVLLDRTVAGVACDSVGLDNEGASHVIVDHLADAGFTAICFVSESFASVSSRREREGAFVDGSARRGVTARTLVLESHLPETVDAVMVEIGEVAARAAKAATGRTAIIAANGQTMLLLAIALLRHPLPGVGLACFDDPEWVALTQPGVTTLRQPTFEIGSRAVHFLNERIDGSTVAPRIETFPAQLIVRSSTQSRT